MTFDQIKQEAKRIGTLRGTVGDRVDNLLDQSRINADDTLYDSELEGDDFNLAHGRIAVSSLELLLGCSKDEEVLIWFRSIGFSW